MYRLAYRLLFIFIFLPSFAFAIVDMRNANFSDTWIDLQVKGSAYDLRVQRTYNSRTLFSGIFGFGWCSEFETKLKVTPENTLRVTECGAGFELSYKPSNYDSGSFDKNIKAILAEVRKRNKGRDEAYFKSLDQQLRTDTDLSDEFSHQFNMGGKVSENAKYLADGRATDYIVYHSGEYTRNLPNGTTQKFDKTGRMIQMSDHNGNFIKITYKGDLLTTVSDNNGNSLQFKFADNGKLVKQINGPGGLSSTYKHSGENLVDVGNAWKNSYKYEYDDMYNMTKAVFPDKTFVELTYNKDKDWVTSFRDRHGCKETYTYADNEKDPLNNYSSAVEKVCDGKITNKSSYEFWHKTKKDGSRFLAKTKSVVNGVVTETTYHEEFGRPTEIITDGIISKFEYYPNGLLKKRSEAMRIFAYKYETVCNKVSQVAVRYNNPPVPQSRDRKPSKVAEAKIVTTDFLYDPKRCNLSTAKNSAGQLASLTYDMRGRITRIVDQSKKEVSITYEERFGKPYIVTRPGLGTIKFKYKADGSMDAFDAKDNQDPLVAVQVANIFSNLLEIIAPATTDVNNI